MKAKTTKVHVEMDSSRIKGSPNGKKLFIITKINQDDFECLDDVIVELYRADDKTDLKHLIIKEYVDDAIDEHQHELWNAKISSDWNNNIIVTEIGTFTKTK